MSCGGPYAVFMVPDFDRLRKQRRDGEACQGHHTDSRSTNHSPYQGYGDSKSFQQFPKHSSKTDLCQPEHSFFELWLACPSWSPILKKEDGWITVVNPSGKKVPLVLGSIESCYRRDIVFGKRFGKLTNYLMIDIDLGSPFHPRNGGIQPILDAMESLGLCRYLLIRSSVSGGLHIYFPLAEPVSSWGIACAAYTALTTAGVTVSAGVCELFPNKKSFYAEHNGHRLPLQDGSFILNDDFGCTSNSKAVFLAQWQTCAAAQDEEHLAEVLTEKPIHVPQPVSASALPPIAWTAKGQSNEIMKKLTNYGHEVVGHKTIQTLGNWIMAVGPRIPGFEQFASKESRNDLTRRNWAYRWAKSHFKAARFYAAKSSRNHNATVAAEALERLLVALDKLVVTSEIGIGKLWRSLSKISQELFGVGFGWKLFQKHRELILVSVGVTGEVGPSSTQEKNKNVSSTESVNPKVAETGRKSKKGLTELSTARYVIDSQNEASSASTPPIEQEDPGVSDEVELAMGVSVVFQSAGSGQEVLRTRVTGKVTQPDGTLLYRLEAHAEGQPLIVTRKCLTVVADKVAAQPGVIRATAAQLLQVLGKACQFTGPGLWAVRREEVSATAWGQLMQLVDEG